MLDCVALKFETLQPGAQSCHHTLTLSRELGSWGWRWELPGSTPFCLALWDAQPGWEERQEVRDEKPPGGRSTASLDASQAPAQPPAHGLGRG